LSSGGNNAARFLLVSGFWTDVDSTIDPLFQMPQDRLKNRLILSVHYYTPSQFCIAGNPNNSYGFRDNWGNDGRAETDYRVLERQFKKLTDNFTSKGIPVIIGEYGVTRQNKVEEGRIRWMTAVTQACIDNGMCPVLWDTGSEISRQPPSYTMRGSLSAVWENMKLP